MTTPSARAKRSRQRAGLSLVEASLGVALVGTALAVFVPVFFRELRTSRISEAPDNLARLHAGAAAYFDAVHALHDTPRQRRCLPDATGRAPAVPGPAAQQVDFASDDVPGAPTWRALGFAPERPVYFSYEVTPTQVGCELTGEGPQLILRAYGDLDGDGMESTFERAAAIGPDSRQLVPSGALYARDRTE